MKFNFESCKTEKIEVIQQENGWIRNLEGKIIAVHVNWFENIQTKLERLEDEYYNQRIEKSIKTLKAELKTDEEYFRGWKDNIAMAIKDNCKNVTHEEANKAAKYFLEILIL